MSKAYQLYMFDMGDQGTGMLIRLNGKYVHIDSLSLDDQEDIRKSVHQWETDRMKDPLTNAAD